MTTIFSRYVFRQAAGAVTLILLSLSGVVWIALALRQLNLVTNQGQDTFTFLKMTTLALPNLMALIAPIALLIATIHTLNRLNGDSELIVLTASGATIWNVGRPLLALGLMVSIAVSVSNHYIMPWSLRLLSYYITQVRTDLLGQVMQPGRFSAPETNLTFHIRDRAPNSDLLDIMMHDARNPKEISTYIAEKGVLIKQGGGSFLVMTTGHILRRSDPKGPAQIIIFDRYAIDLDRFEAKTSDGEMKVRERYYDELVNPAPNDSLFKREPGQFRAELHERLSNPLYPIAFVMIALAFVGQAQSTRQNRAQSIVAGFVIATALRLVGMAMNNLVVLRASATPLLYLLPMSAILISLVMLQFGNRQRPGPSLTERILDPIGDALARLKPRPRQRAGAAAR